ncbi:MAG TPA: gas vesicle protein [Thermoanaerobaculia bacterium]|nr:gas vesicle protein [Thermoanaerobaculia bacterium]
MTDDRDLSLVETLDHLLDRGVVIAGEAVISVGDVDLLYLGLNVVLANVDSLTRAEKRAGGGPRRAIEE